MDFGGTGFISENYIISNMLPELTDGEEKLILWLRLRCLILYNPQSFFTITHSVSSPKKIQYGIRRRYVW